MKQLIFLLAEVLCLQFPIMKTTHPLCVKIPAASFHWLFLILDSLQLEDVRQKAAGNNVMAQFARLYPLDQRDYPLERKPLDFGPLMPRKAKIENPSRDYTPPSESSPCYKQCLHQSSLLAWLDLLPLSDYEGADAMSRATSA